MYLDARLRVLLAALVFLLSSGCGGGGGDDLFSGGTTTIYASNLTLFQDGSADPVPTALRAGDTAADVGMRIGVRFALIDPLFLTPTADEVQSATLRLRQTGALGMPYTVLGTIVVDRVDFGLTLGQGDFAPTTLTADLGTLSSDASLGIRDVDVTAAVVAALRAGSLTSDFLIRFTGTFANQVAEHAEFERSTSNGDGPLLLITRR